MRSPWLLCILTLGSLLLPPALQGREADPAAPAFSAQQQPLAVFQPPVRPPLPSVSNPSWMRTFVDGFIHARLDQAGLSPAQPADRAALLRRLTFDLIGLPPTPPESDDFFQDTRPVDYVRVVERLVVPAFNDDRPFDCCLAAQLAGDRLGRCLSSQSSVINPRSSIDFLRIVTGFSRCGPIHQTSGNVDAIRDLEGRTLRDNALSVAGTLNPALDAPSIRVPLEPKIDELIFANGEPDGLWPATPDPRGHGRRRLYLYNKRNVRLPLLEAFDQPDILTSRPVPPTSPCALQALTLLNGPSLRQQAAAFAARLLRRSPAGETNCIERAYRLVLARRPADEERRRVGFPSAAEGSDSQAITDAPAGDVAGGPARRR